MAGEEVTVLRLCSVCGFELGKLTPKRENLMLASPREPVWCPRCNANRREIREVEGRGEAVVEERKTYPISTPAEGPRAQGSLKGG